MSNPMINTFSKEFVSDGEPMTIKGTVTKTFALFALAFAAAMYTWYLVATGMADKANMFIALGAIGGFICVIISAFKPEHSKILGITYALCEGLALGAISAAYEAFYHGIVAQAFLGTFITLFIMLTLYKTGVIRATQTLQRVIFTALISILIFYLAVLLAVFFKISFLAPLVAAYNNPIVIGIIIVVAAFCLILDFNKIETFANGYYPHYFEWYGALSLMVTLVWLYVEFLRLVANLRNK